MSAQWLRVRAADDRGLSLVELLVTLTILSAIMGSLTTAFIAMQRTSAESDQRQEDLGTSQVAMSAMGRALRTAIEPPTNVPAFSDASPQRVEFYANLGGNTADPPSLVTYEVVADGDGRALRETTVPGSTDGGDYELLTAESRSRLLARGISDQPLFRYHDANEPYATFTPDVTDPASLRQIRAVSIELGVRSADHLNVNATDLQTRVRLPNLRD